ncbi:MAG TPA: hypothetical protein VIC33_04785 [Vicinamibacterales bacterium]
MLHTRVEELDRSAHRRLAPRRSMCRAADALIHELELIGGDGTQAISILDFAQVCEEADAAVASLERFLDGQSARPQRNLAVASKIYEIRRAQEIVLTQVRQQRALIEAPIITMAA